MLSRTAKPAAAALFVAMLLLGGGAVADTLDTIGYTTIRNSGLLLADGAGIRVALVEVGASGAYAPDSAYAGFAGKTITLRSGASATSAHATLSGQNFFGVGTSPAPGITEIDSFRDDSFLASAGLNTGNTLASPVALNVSVINNSWVAAYEQDSSNVDAIRRLDYLARRDNVLVVAGVDNSDSNPFPKLLASSYNGLAVGNSTGASSSGPVSFDGGPRSKPDLVAPAANTSIAAAVASGSGALLLSEAKARGFTTSQLATKAMLMAGAQRLAGWQRGAAGTADDPTSPLDYRQGAGELRLNNSFAILRNKEQAPGAKNGKTGWDVAQISAGQRKDYNISYRATVPQLSIALAWNRLIAGTVGGLFNATPTLNNLRLTFYRKTLSSTGKTVYSKVAVSRSTTDNVQTLWFKNVKPGQYAIRVEASGPEEYALAWLANFHPEPTAAALALPALPANAIPAATPDAYRHAAIPEPSAAFLAVGLVALLARRRR